MALFLPIDTDLICTSSLQVGNRPVVSPPFPEVLFFFSPPDRYDRSSLLKIVNIPFLFGVTVYDRELVGGL